MWIRSQNKLFLVEAKRILILSPNAYRKKFEIVNYVSETPSIECGTFAGYDSLGEYESKKRTIEVLDEIQKHIELIEHNKIFINQPEEQYNYEYYIFQMPEK